MISGKLQLLFTLGILAATPILPLPANIVFLAFGVFMIIGEMVWGDKK